MEGKPPGKSGTEESAGEGRKPSPHRQDASGRQGCPGEAYGCGIVLWGAGEGEQGKRMNVETASWAARGTDDKWKPQFASD